jgi:hypothetical protein
MDLGILNTIIALVVVLLVLSLLVQSFQTLLKKILKLKSRQIEDSLKDLYEQVAGGPTETAPQTSFLSALKSFVGRKSASVAAPADVFKEKVLEQFKLIGRQTLFGNAVLDSLSKTDLFKVMGKLESEDFFPDYVPKFQLLCDQIKDLRSAIEDITNDPALRGAATTKIAEIRSILAPIFNNVEAILEGTQVKPKVLFADLLRLGQIDVHGLLSLLDEAQQAITRETAAATAAGNTGEVAALQNISAKFAQVSKLIGDMSQKYVDAISPLRNKIDQVELWFDTVTQSFDERYTRHMKTISLVISIVVVILLNANFFQVYKSLSRNEIQRNMLVDAGSDLVKDNAAQPSVTPTSRPNASPSPSPNSSPTPNAVAELKKDLHDIDSLVGTYENLGFKPLSAEQLRAFIWSTGVWTKPWPDDNGYHSWGGFKLTKELKDGNEVSSWHAQSGAEWWESRKDDVTTIVGWVIMIMLLSVGAPFWQDALESLFGIKNLLRQKSNTQNIETQSGAGQPRE